MSSGGPSSPNIIASPTENMIQPKLWTNSPSEDRALVYFAIRNVKRIRVASLWQEAVDDVAELRHRRPSGIRRRLLTLLQSGQAYNHANDDEVLSFINMLHDRLY
ncbi:hypothetical protein JTB14_032481 [Gonioctena quinquepunctata]|nr:hypothetical protein JTB14_032481 [Gonioctena quinquepunctata]